jgi:hypothetical protein
LDVRGQLPRRRRLPPRRAIVGRKLDLQGVGPGGGLGEGRRQNQGSPLSPPRRKMEVGVSSCGAIGCARLVGNWIFRGLGREGVTDAMGAAACFPPAATASRQALRSRRSGIGGVCRQTSMVKPDARVHRSGGAAANFRSDPVIRRGAESRMR